MNDRFLFRGKRVDNDEWVVGSIQQWETGELNIIQLEDVMVDSETNYKELNSIHYLVDPKTVCQCTCETDMKNTKLFEGDVVQMDSWSPNKMFIGFIEGAFCLCHLEKYKNTGEIEYVGDIHYIQHAGRKQAKIIGTIHD